MCNAPWKTPFPIIFSIPYFTEAILLIDTTLLDVAIKAYFKAPSLAHFNPIQ